MNYFLWGLLSGSKNSVYTLSPQKSISSCSWGGGFMMFPTTGHPPGFVFQLRGHLLLRVTFIPVPNGDSTVSHRNTLWMKGWKTIDVLWDFNWPYITVCVFSIFFKSFSTMVKLHLGGVAGGRPFLGENYTKCWFQNPLTGALMRFTSHRKE